MRAGLAAAIVAASLSAGGAAWSACPHGQSRNCLDLDAVPQISQRIVAREHVAPAPKSAPAAEKPPAYTGPTVGLSRMVRQVPILGYRWSTD